MSFNFNDAERQSNFDVIPANTLVRLVMTIRPGGGDEDGWLTRSKSSDSQYFNCEFTVFDGPYTRRKIWSNIGWSGGKTNEKGESIYGNMGRSMLRAIIESAKGIRPDDQSQTAIQGRTVSGWGDFNQFCFLAKLGVEKGVDGYQDKNKILAVITPEMKEYQQTGPSGAQPVHQAAPAQASTPAWAQGPAPQQAMRPQAAASPVPAWAR